MKIGINASFVRKPDVGMGQVAINFLENLFLIANPEDTFFLYLEEDLDLDLPNNFHKRITKTFYKRDDLVKKTYWEKYLLPRAAKRDKCDVFFSLYQSASVMGKIPHLMLVHDTIVKIFPWYLNNSRKIFYYKRVDKAIKKASKIMTVSKHSRVDVARLYNKQANDIVVNYIDCDPIFKSNITLDQAENVLRKFNLKPKEYIFYVGGFDMRKNMSGLIHSYALLWDSYQNKADCPDLVLAGGYNPKLIPLVTDIDSEIEMVRSKFGIPNNRFKRLGFVKQEDLPFLYRGSSLFCYPSLYEGFGLPVLEAFNCGCPVVSSANSSLKEIVNNKNAFIFKLKSDSELAEQLDQGLNNKEKRKEKIKQARIDAKNFDWKNFVELSLETLRDMSKNKR